MFPLHTFPTVKPVKQTLWTNAIMRTQHGYYSQARFTQCDCKLDETFLSCTDFRISRFRTLYGRESYQGNITAGSPFGLKLRLQVSNPQHGVPKFCFSHKSQETPASPVMQQFCTFSFCSKLPANFSHTCKSGSGGSILAPWSYGSITKHQ